MPKQTTPAGAQPEEVFEVTWIPLSDLTPHPLNYRKHPQAQIEEIIASVRENSVYRPVVVGRGNVILAGHGLTEALTQMGRASAPCYVVDVDPYDARARKLLAGDNGIGDRAEDDEAMLAALLTGIYQETGSLAGTGSTPEDLMALLTPSPDAAPAPATGDADDQKYSRRIVAPIYHPTEEVAPDEEELYDRSKTDRVLARIEAVDLPEEVAAFLRNAAERHTIFKFDRIAEYYAHAPAEVQALMEESALVIIDFDKAVEHGFVRLTEKLLAYAETSKWTHHDGRGGTLPELEEGEELGASLGVSLADLDGEGDDA